MRLVIISDTHNQIGTSGKAIYDVPKLKELILPEGDVLIHCGDHTAQGNRSQLELAAEWLGGYRNQFKAILTIAGNHDFICQEKSQLAQMIFMHEGIGYMQDSGFIFEEVNFYGSPWQPWFYDWAFNFPEEWKDLGHEQAIKTWKRIPDNTNVLITHGPPKGILDKTYGGEDDRVGCPYLRQRILDLKELKVHCFGHIHEAAGVYEENGLTFINAAICDRQKYAPIQPARVIDI